MERGGGEETEMSGYGGEGERESISFGDSVSLSEGEKGDCFLHPLSQLTSTSTLGPNWM